MSWNVYAKFGCAPLCIKKALGIFRELIPRTTRTTTIVAFWDPPSGSKNSNCTIRELKHMQQYYSSKHCKWPRLMHLQITNWLIDQFFARGNLCCHDFNCQQWTDPVSTAAVTVQVENTLYNCPSDTKMTSCVHIVGYKSIDGWVTATESPKYLPGRHTTTERQVRVTKSARYMFTETRQHLSNSYD